jgi:RNA polymerase sigma-70 factor (sigma-E family)
VRPRWEQDYVEFVRVRIARLHRIAYRLLGDGDRADDAVQNVLATLYGRWPTLHGVENLDGYVHTMVVRACLSDWRRSWSRVLLREMPPDRPVEHVDHEVELRLLLRAALRELPEPQRVVLALRFLCDLSVSDVARLLNRPEGTVKSQTAHGLSALRKVMGVVEPRSAS